MARKKKEHQSIQVPVMKAYLRGAYDMQKFRLQNRPDLKEASKGHIHMMAKRYMIKQFLVDLHKAWRPLVGLTTSEPYHIAKLHYKSHEGR